MVTFLILAQFISEWFEIEKTCKTPTQRAKKKGIDSTHDLGRASLNSHPVLVGG
jgi:hypothetical protein